MVFMKGKDEDDDEAAIRLLMIISVDEDCLIIRLTNGFNYYMEAELDEEKLGVLRE